VKEGDVAVIASHDTSVPFSNNGSYRVSKVIDEKTIELMGLDHGPILLNSLGVLGTVTIQTDTNFFYQPYAKLNFAPPSGTYRVIFKKYSSLLEMVDDVDAFATSPTRFTQEAPTDLQKVVKAIIGPSATTFNEYLYNDKRNSLENLYFRISQEHDEVGHHPYLYITDTMPGSAFVGKKLAVQYDADPAVAGDSTAGFSVNVRSLTSDVSGVSAVNVAAENNDTVGTYRTDVLGAIWGEVGVTNVGNIHQADVFSGYVRVDAAGEVNYAHVFRAASPDITGTVTALYGMRIDAVTGGITNYGIRVDAVTGGTTNYGIRIIGADPGYALRVDSGFTWLEGAVAMDDGVAHDDYSLRVRRISRATSSYEYAGQFHMQVDDPPSSTYPVVLNVVTDCNLGTGESHGQLRGILNDLDKDGDGDIDSWYGNRLNYSVNGGTVGSINAYYSGGSIVSGTVTNLYGFHYDEPSVSGTLAAQYGVDISPMSLATNNFGVRIRGASPGYSLYVDSGYTRLIGAVCMDEAAPDDDISLNIHRSVSGATSQNTIYSLLDIDAASTATMSNIFMNTRATHATDSVTNLRGIQQNIYKTGAGNITNIYGVRNYLTIGGGGTVSSLVGFSHGGNINTPTTLLSGVCFQAENLGVTGTLTTQYGLRVGDLTSGATNYGAYFEGASTAAIYVAKDRSYFVDATTLGGTLDVTSWNPKVGVESAPGTVTAATTGLASISKIGGISGTHNQIALAASMDILATASSGGAGRLTGLYADVFTHHSAGCDITHAQAIEAWVGNYGTGTITNAYGLYVWENSKNSGTMTNAYGIYIENQRDGATNYGLRIIGASPGYAILVDSGYTWLKGNTGIGDVNPTTSTLQVARTGATGYAEAITSNFYVPASDASQIAGLSSTLRFNMPSGSRPSAMGMLCHLDQEGAGVLNTWYGIRALYSLDGGNVNAVQLFYANGTQSSGTVANMYGLRYYGPVQTGGAVTVQYGIKIEDLHPHADRERLRV
jgi:hypothetical protein